MDDIFSGRALSIAEVAAICGVATTTMKKWVSKGKGPITHKLGRRRVIFGAHLERWLRAHEDLPQARKRKPS